ncbi:MAG: hypothetical protein MJD61_17085 [Proteobacteria bacterium]|nr:hypothetical protein [Pseudomonadota bacterium]
MVNWDDFETEAIAAAREAREQARAQFVSQGTVASLACIWKLRDPLTGERLPRPTKVYLEFPTPKGKRAPTGRAALRQVQTPLRAFESLAALLVTVVPDTERPEYKVCVQLETPGIRRRVWMASIRGEDGILGDFEEEEVGANFYLLPPQAA